MPLPSSGSISADDLNEELGNSPGTQIDFESAANALLENASRPHGMDEFYGASLGDDFLFSDWDGSVSISEYGSITATVGNAASRTINTSNFAVVTSATSRSVSVTIVAPSTFNGEPVTNAGASLTGTRSATQPSIGRYLELTANDYSLEGQETQVSLTINDLHYNDTDWTLSDVPTYGTNGLELAIYNEFGTGDTTRTINLSQNTSGTTRRSTFTVTSAIGSKTDSIEISQTSYTPVQTPTFEPVPTSEDWTDSQSGTGVSKVITANYNGGSAPTSVTFYLSGTHFGLQEEESNVQLIESGGPWRAQATNTSGISQYRIGVYPLSTNSGTSDKEENLVISMGNGSGTNSINVPLTQTFNVSWETDVSSLSFTRFGGTKNIILTTSYNWTAAVSGTGFSINTTSGTAGTRTISVTATQKDLGGSGTVTFSASGQSDIVVSLSQAAAPLEWDWFVNELPRIGDSVTVSPSTIAQSYSVGLYTYRGSTAVASTWMLQRTAGTWITINTTTSGGTTFKDAESTQNTNGTPYLYLNVATNTGSPRTGGAEITIDGALVATISVQQSGVSGGSGGSGGDPSEGPGAGGIE